MLKNKGNFLVKSKFIALAITLLVSSFISFFSIFLNSTQVHADSTADNLNSGVVAYQYYTNLFVNNVCGIKDDVSGTDIGKYNFWNVWGTKWANTGLVTTPSTGAFNCGDTNNTSSFTKGAANALGLNSSDPGELLCQLGYTQTVASSNATKTSCATSNTTVGGTDSFHINDAGNNVRKYILAHSLNGKAPQWTDAMAYWSTLQDFFQGCSAKVAASGSYGGNVANIRVVDSSGSITTQGYTYTTDDKAPFSAPGDINNPSSTGSCSTLVTGLDTSSPQKYVTAYQTYILQSSCSTQYSDNTQAQACVKGAQNKTNIDYCTTTYKGTSNKDARLACYVGQGNQGEDACVSVYQYTLSNGLMACIKGAQNASDPNYCTSQYPLPDALNYSGKLAQDTNKVARDACLSGQQNPAGGGLTVNTPAGSTPGTNPPGSDASTCSIPGVGWIVCPVVNFLASVADNAFSFLSDNFLRVDVSTVSSDAKSPTYIAWSSMRTIANVAFVIAFLIIIFSQLTGQGIANYGIKKMLPRLVIAAILVNASFFVCQLAIDLSNILGVSLKSLFDSAGGGITLPTTIGSESGNWVGIAAAVLAGTAIAWALGISVLLPFLIAAVIAFIMVFLILVVRQLLIILLVVVAPIAFVAYLLPNTEQWFTKWRKMFTTLLLVFPMIGLLFGAAGLASKVMNAAAYSSTQDTSGWIMKIVAAGTVALPLFLLPSMLKRSLDAVGNIGQTMNKIGDRIGGGARKSAANTGLMKNYAAQKAQKRAAIATGTYAGVNPISRLRSGTNRALNKSSLFNRATSGYGADRTILGQGQQRKDAQEAMAMFGGDDDLVEAWGFSGGDLNKAKEEFRLRKGRDLSKAQVEQFKLMQNAGHARKPTSFLAVAQYLSESGKADGTVVQQALERAKAAGASDIQVGSAGAAAVAAYRKSGRGDAVAQLAVSTGIDPAMTMEKGWGQVAPSAVHRDGIKPGTAGLLAYQNHLNSDAEHTRQALMGFDAMEQRAKTLAEAHILAAAQKHETAATGAATSTITNIRQAKDYFGVK